MHKSASQHPFSMKNSNHIVLAITLMVTHSIVFAQAKYPVAKVYAYKQEEYSGVNRRLSDQNGKIIQGKNSSTNYFLYLEYYHNKNITIDNIWINGQAYEAASEKMNTPITITQSKKTAKKQTVDTLVPSTTREVINIRPGLTKSSVVMSKYTKRLVRTNELVFAYTYGNKKYYLAVKSIKQLAPDLNQ